MPTVPLNVLGLSSAIDDDMPALVDNPHPSLTDSFDSRMTPLSYPPANIPNALHTSSSSNPPSPSTPDDSTTSNHLHMSHTKSHGKRRDPSYIPRPSNAFILFRSAFIRDRKVSDKVEGKHSSLSKIIGHSWKKLSPNEREKWEAEAVAAQAQHRAMYPDWRFRPGANALAKLKIDTDQGEKRKGKEKGRNKPSARMLSLRCAKIADFVADGIRGEELEVAVKEWEGDRKMGKEKTQRPRLSRTRGASTASTHAPSDSLSPQTDIPAGPSGTNTATTTTSFDTPPTPQQHLTWQDAENQRRIEEMQEPNSWWGESRSAEVEVSTFGYASTQHSQCSSGGISEMGYENCGGTHYFDGGYVEYGSFDSPHDASQNVEWTDLSNDSDRLGLVTVLHNPYKDGNSPNTSPHTLTPPTVYHDAPPLSDSSYYYTQVSPSSPLPPSSFSTLTGWAGDYKTQTSTWPNHHLPTSAPPSS